MGSGSVSDGGVGWRRGDGRWMDLGEFEVDGKDLCGCRGEFLVDSEHCQLGIEANEPASLLIAHDRLTVSLHGSIPAIPPSSPVRSFPHSINSTSLNPFNLLPHHPS